MANPNIVGVTVINGNTAQVFPSNATSAVTSWTYNGTTALTGLTPAASTVNRINQLVVSNVTASAANATVFLAGAPYTSTLSSVVSLSTNGTFSCTSSTLAVGQPITLSGTYGGTGSITGYANPTTYYIITTNGTTTFTLSATFGGSAVVTTAGTSSGITYTTPLAFISFLAYQISVPPNASLIVSDKTTAFYITENQSLAVISGTASALTYVASFEAIT